jgi:glycosyltransferase involved in cell wall biosynthesis
MLYALSDQSTTVRPSMSAHPAVSIGMPVYNAERYLVLSLESVLRQDFDDLEVILSDNGSTDSTQEICESFARRDSRVRYVRHETNRGAAWNFNETFRLSRAPYFKWQCYDDLIESDMIRLCYDTLQSERDVVLCCTRTRIINGDGDTVRLWEDGVDLTEPTPHGRLRHFMFKRNTAHLMCQFGLMRRSALETTRRMGAVPFSETIIMAEMAVRGQFRELPSYSFIMRHHPKSSTSLYYHDLRALGIFLDPARSGKRIWLGLERVVEFLRIVRGARLSSSEAARCYAVILRFIALTLHAKGRRLVGRTLRRIGA